MDCFFLLNLFPDHFPGVPDPRRCGPLGHRPVLEHHRQGGAGRAGLSFGERMGSVSFIPPPRWPCVRTGRLTASPSRPSITCQYWCLSSSCHHQDWLGWQGEVHPEQNYRQHHLAKLPAHGRHRDWVDDGQLRQLLREPGPAEVRHAELHLRTGGQSLE